MHFLVSQETDLDEIDDPVDLGHSPGDIVVLSFSDSDLAGFAAAAETLGREIPSLRLAKLSQLRHPMSVDLYVDAVIAKAKFVLVRLLGGLDYWRYGAERLYALARERGIALAILPGDALPDRRLLALSTVDDTTWETLWSYCIEGGAENLLNALRYAATFAGAAADIAPPKELPRFGAYLPDHGPCNLAEITNTFDPDKPSAAIVFYRALIHAEDLAAIDALHGALRARGFNVLPLFVASLKETEASQFIRETLQIVSPAVIVNTTAFSTRTGAKDASPLDIANVPVLQAALASADHQAWFNSSRGLGATDLAMNVVLPEIDGRIFAGAVSFKQQDTRIDSLEFARHIHAPDVAAIDHLASLAANWASLSTKENADKNLALILPDYPGKAGRAGSGVGLDGPASAQAILSLLAASDYGIGDIPSSSELFHRLTEGTPQPFLDLASYRALFAELPEAARANVIAAWGEPEKDPDFRNGFFASRRVDLGKALVVIQPDRAGGRARKEIYHDPKMPPCHAYIAFHLWLRRVRRIDAFIMVGAHGTLEWLPGKAVALSDTCFPKLMTGTTPVLYPFIVSNPGEAAQAKRRLGAVTIGHMTPPVILAGLDPAVAEIEALVDEFSTAQTLDPRRAKRLADIILSNAATAGLLDECGISPFMTPAEAITRLDAMLCDLKEMRIRDGQHVYGQVEAGDAEMLDAAFGIGMAQACADSEARALLEGLSGRFIEPGPAGAPSRGRRDTLPTGRNLFTVDPRAIPTRMATTLGQAAAGEFVRRYLQDHGEWPRHIVFDLWASTSMRTGGEDFAQGLALLGVRPQWDHASTRVTGFEILPHAKLDHPRIDVTLRISGLFRDVFPAQVSLFEAAGNAVAALDEPDDVNPLAARRRAGNAETSRIFGPSPQTYGSGLESRLADGSWNSRADLGAAYLTASSHSYGHAVDGDIQRRAFSARLAGVDAVLHINDVPESDALETDSIAAHVGGLAAAARLNGAKPALYESDTGTPERPMIRTYKESVARATRGRAANPRWIEGQMRHGATGAAAMANAVDALFAMAAAASAAGTEQFDLLYNAYLGDDAVCRFLQSANPQACHAIIERFEEAIRRDLWTPRRNSIGARLAELKELTGSKDAAL
ncbi:MAG TPA: cobaltochelatase subunit CobN [Parvibaculum sp.]|jgi:cobaltochelatase CobN